MAQPYKSYVAQNFTDLLGRLSIILIYGPKCLDSTGYFPYRNIDTEFCALNEALDFLRKKLGEELYAKLKDMSDRTRVYYEADPEDTTGDTFKGRQLIQDMEDLIHAHRRKR